MNDAVEVNFALTGTKLRDEHRKICVAMNGAPPDADTFQLADYDPSAIQEASVFWHNRTLAEHRSVAVFLLLGAQLIEANASLDEKTVMLKLAQDELRHTELCAQALRAFRCEQPVLADVSVVPLAKHAGCSIEERALRNVLYTTCLSEMVAAARLVDALERTEDPYIRAVTRLLLQDEVMHGRFGFLYLEARAEALAETPGLTESLGDYLRHAFVILERELAPESYLTMRRPSKEAERLGVMDPRQALDVFYNTMEHVIVPGLELHGIPAARAWEERALSQ